MISSVVVVDFAAWNSSWERQQVPEFTPQWTLQGDHPELLALLRRIAPLVRVNERWTLETFVRERPAVEARPREPTEMGASPARTEVRLWLSDGSCFTVGEHPLYTVSAPFDELVALVRRCGRHELFDLKRQRP